jgi:allophanate hydrolase subunit 1
MSNEDLNSKMEFIIEWQAKFAADMEMMREVHAADSRLVKDGLIGLIDICGHLARSQMRTDETVNSLTEDFRRLTQAQARTEEAQAHTEERLTILINTVERHMGGNGGAENRA